MELLVVSFKKKHCTKNEVFHLLKKSLMENFIFCAVKDVWGMRSASDINLQIRHKYNKKMKSCLVYPNVCIQSDHPPKLNPKHERWHEIRNALLLVQTPLNGFHYKIFWLLHHYWLQIGPLWTYELFHEVLLLYKYLIWLKWLQNRICVLKDIGFDEEGAGSILVGITMACTGILFPSPKYQHFVTCLTPILHLKGSVEIKQNFKCHASSS